MKKILVIDDESPILSLFQRIIARPGWQVDVALSGQEGVARFREGSHDMVFLDLNMPDVDGVETLREIRHISHTVPVYITTGYYERFTDRLKALENEDGTMAYEILHKPIDPAIVRILVDNFSDPDEAGGREMPSGVSALAKKVLVIDDDEAIRKSFLLALEDTAYGVQTAASGEAGIERVRQGGFGLIYLDLKMPGINGVETLKQIREIDGSVPIYIITAFHQEFFGPLEEAKAAGLSFELFRKPMGSDQIVMLTKSVLDEPIVY